MSHIKILPLEETVAKLPEKRKESKAHRNFVSDTYGISDALKRVLDLPCASGFLGFNTNGRGSGLRSDVPFIRKNTL
jgi:hypothetical protein